MSRIAKLRQLTWPERRILIGALVLMPLTALGLRLFGLRRVQATLARRGPFTERKVAGNARSIPASQVARLVGAAARHAPYRATCLPIALTLQRLLSHEGIQADLRLGVRKVAGRGEAHAWLEYQGAPLGDVHERFAAFEEVISNLPLNSR